MTPLFLIAALLGQAPSADSDRQLLRHIALEERIDTLDHADRLRRRRAAWNGQAQPRVVFVQSPGMPQAPSAPQPAPVIIVINVTAPQPYQGPPQQPGFSGYPPVVGMPPPMYFTTYYQTVRRMAGE